MCVMLCLSDLEFPPSLQGNSIVARTAAAPVWPYPRILLHLKSFLSLYIAKYIMWQNVSMSKHQLMNMLFYLALFFSSASGRQIQPVVSCIIHCAIPSVSVCARETSAHVSRRKKTVNVVHRGAGYELHVVCGHLRLYAVVVVVFSAPAIQPTDRSTTSATVLERLYCDI